jgi:hypothetical protein
MTRLAILTILTALTATGAAAQDRSPPDAMAALRACRGLPGDAARLACFDQAAGALDAAEASGEVLVVGRTEIQDTRQRLFGLDVPNVRLLERFGAQGRMDAVETSLTRGYQTSGGEWVFELADGSIWRQIDTERFAGRASPGAQVRVRRAAMGSYFINVDGARALRARRDR